MSIEPTITPEQVIEIDEDGRVHLPLPQELLREPPNEPSSATADTFTDYQLRSGL